MPDEVRKERSTAIQSDRGRSSKVLKGLFIAFILLIFAVIAGVYWDWPKIPESMEQHGQLLESLIANGISVILSVILITPLTVYFINDRREKRLVPVRENFIESLSAALERIATAHLHYLSFHYIQIQGLQAMIAVDMFEAITEKINESFEETRAKIAHAQPPEFEDQESIIYKLVMKTRLLESTTQRHYDIMYRETQDVENTLTFAMPQFPVEAVTLLHRIRVILMEYRERLRAMLALLSGISDPVTVGQAGMSVLDFRDLLNAFTSVRRVCGIDTPVNLNWATRMAEPAAVYQQGKFAEGLVSLFKEARDADGRLGVRSPVPQDERAGQR